MGGCGVAGVGPVFPTPRMCLDENPVLRHYQNVRGFQKIGPFPGSTGQTLHWRVTKTGDYTVRTDPYKVPTVGRIASCPARTSRSADAARPSRAGVTIAMLIQKSLVVTTISAITATSSVATISPVSTVASVVAINYERQIESLRHRARELIDNSISNYINLWCLVSGVPILTIQSPQSSGAWRSIASTV